MNQYIRIEPNNKYVKSLFVVNMWSNQSEFHIEKVGGNTWNEAQYRQWLTEAGFIEIEVTDLMDKGKQLITAFRKHK